MASPDVGSCLGEDGISADDYGESGGSAAGAIVGVEPLPVGTVDHEHEATPRAAGERLRRHNQVLRQPEGHQPGPLSARTNWRQKAVAGKASKARPKLRVRKKRKREPGGLPSPPDLGSAFVPIRNYDLALNKIEELQKVIQQSENRLQLIFANPHLIALARGDPAAEQGSSRGIPRAAGRLPLQPHPGVG